MKETSQTKKTARRTLWVVTELYYPEETSTGYYLTRIAESLADDFEVRVLCGQPNYSRRGVRSPARERHRGVEIFRARGTTLDKNKIPRRLINMLTLGWTMFWTVLFRFKKNDLILVVTTPPSLPFIAAVAARLKGGRYVLLIHDNYPEILIAVGKAGADSTLVKFLHRINRRLYRAAAKIIVVGRDMRELLEKKTVGLAVPIEYIPNWAELEQVSPSDRQSNELLQELNLTDRFVFLYAGNMGHPNDLESLIVCAEQLENQSDAHFIFLGAGVKRRWLEREVERKKLSNVTLLSPRPRREQQVFLNACDVAIVSLVSRMKGVSMPSRTYNILAAGKPILALTETGSELARVVLEERVGWVAAPNAPSELLNVIAEIEKQRQTLPAMNERARRAALEKYSLDAAAKKYQAALTDGV